MFTDRLVSGGSRPDYRYIAVHSKNQLADFKIGTLLYNRSTNADSVPVVSSISGFSKVLAGLIHSIVHLVLAIFDKLNRSLHLQEAGLGGRSIVRGLVSIVPFAGNYAIQNYDLNRQETEIRESVKFEEGFAIYYENGREVSKKNAEVYYQKLKEPNLSPQKLIRFMKNGYVSAGDKPLGGIGKKDFIFWEKPISFDAASYIVKFYSQGGTYLDVALDRESIKHKKLKKAFERLGLTAENYAALPIKPRVREWISSMLPRNRFMEQQTKDGSFLVLRTNDDQFLSSNLDHGNFSSLQDKVRTLTQEIENLGLVCYEYDRTYPIGPLCKEIKDF